MWSQACQRVRLQDLIGQLQGHLQDRVSHCSTSSSSSSSSPTVISSDTKTREREDRIESDISPVTVSTTVDDRSRRPVVDQANKAPKTNKKEPQTDRGDPLYSDIPEWLQEFRENLVDDEIPEHRDSHASSSHEPSLEPTPAGSVDLGKHSIYIHFPERPKLRDLSED